MKAHAGSDGPTTGSESAPKSQEQRKFIGPRVVTPPVATQVTASHASSQHPNAVYECHTHSTTITETTVTRRAAGNASPAPGDRPPMMTSRSYTRSASCTNETTVKEHSVPVATLPQHHRCQSLPTAPHPPPLILTCPPSAPQEGFSEPHATSFAIRSLNYKRNNVKQSSAPALFPLMTMDFLLTTKGSDALNGGVCSYPHERIQRALAREKETGIKELPEYVFAVNLALPGEPAYNVVMYYAVEEKSVLTDTTTPFGRLASRFFFGDSDEFRDETFKLIPRVMEGNFVVKKAVGGKPTLLGKKIKLDYVRTDRFMEVVVGIGSDKVATKVVKLTQGAAKSLVIDMAFVLEGNDESTLPEQIMSCITLKNLDFKKFPRKVAFEADDASASNQSSDSNRGIPLWFYDDPDWDGEWEDISVDAWNALLWAHASL